MVKFERQRKSRAITVFWIPANPGFQLYYYLFQFSVRKMMHERYRKQMLFHGIGTAGQKRLMNSRVLLTGCGALGCVLADAMVRAGVGHVRIVDRDFVELSNLQRQMLYTEDDVQRHLPKSIAAADRLRRVNSEVAIEPIVADVDFRNILDLARGSNLILDGTDNFEIRYLMNDVSLELGIPWIFTGCTGSYGQMMPIFPGRSACLRCLMRNPPPPGSTETCDTAGVLGPAIGVVASLQAALALRILSDPRSAESPGDHDRVPGATSQPPSESAGPGPDETAGDNLQITGIPLQLTMVDVWEGTFRQMDISRLRQQTDCPACRHGERLWLTGTQRQGSTVLCGRNAVQVVPSEKLRITLPELAQRLQASGAVTVNSFLVRVHLAESVLDSEVEITVFPDGRAIIKGTEDPAVARSLYSRYVGA